MMNHSIRRKSFFIILFASSLSLSGCKIPAEVGEGIFRTISNIIGRLVSNYLSNDNPTPNKNPPTESLPFTLKQGDKYVKKEATADTEAYYIVTRQDGTIEHYALNGELLWSNIEGELEENSIDQPTELLGLDLSDLNHEKEKFDVRTELEPHTTEQNGQINYFEKHYIIITSLNEQPIEIKSVKINRGYCKGHWSLNSSSLLNHYSESTKILLSGCKINDVHEVNIQTQHDQYVHEF